MKFSSSRVLPIAVSAVLVLGACGGDDSTADDSPVDSVDDQPGLRAPTPIEITQGRDGGGNLSAAATAEDAPASGVAASDMMIAPAYWISEYVAGGGMPALPTDDTGYVFDASRAITADQIAQLATALGVEGEPVRIEEQWGTSWRVGPDDGSAPSLWVSEDGQQAWNYSPAWQEREAVVGCAVSIDSDGNESEACPELEPPVGVPTLAEGEQLASDLMESLGEDPSGLAVDSHGDDWFASVTFRDVGDPRASLREWNFGFGAESVLQYASGVLATAEPVGPYPLIDLDTALARLNDQNYWFGGGGGSIEPGIAIAEAPPADLAVESGVAVDAEIAVDMPESEVVEGSSGSAEGSEGGADATTDSVIADEPIPVEPDGGIGDGAEPLPGGPVEPMPVEPMPEPEPVVVTLVDVQADLWWAWDVDGSVWLLPAYRFIDADGGWHTVPAVTDEFMIQAEPPVFVGEPEPVPAPEPMPVEVAPDPAEPGTDVPESDVPESDVPEPIEDGPDVTEPDAVIVELNEVLPLPLDEFTVFATERGFSTRVVMQDGESMAVTADFSESRLNVAAEGDTVVAVQSIG